MKRLITAAVAVLVFVLVLVAQTGTSTARISPVETAAAPTVRQQDDFYRANPMKVTPRPVPFVDANGDTIVEEQVMEIPNHEPLLLRVKATPQPVAEVSQGSPLTFQSPVSYNNTYYLPIIGRGGKRHALALVYQGESQAPGVISPRDNAIQLAGDLFRASVWHGDPNGAYSFDIGLVNNDVVMIYTYPPTQANGYFDVPAIYAQHNVCARVQSGEIDEVWIYADGKPGGNIYSDNEFTANGPVYSIMSAGIPNVPNCGKQIFTLFYNFDRDEANAMESWAHSLEHTVRWFITGGYEICDVDPPSAGRDSHCTGGYAYSYTYGFMNQPRPENNYIGVCGLVHWPPNRPVGSEPYIYNDQTSYNSRCEDWDWGDPGGVVSVNRDTWGPILGCQPNDTDCHKRAYFIWWMRHMPSINNTSHGRAGALRPNWLAFRLQP
jgi:hypothetical protein